MALALTRESTRSVVCTVKLIVFHIPLAFSSSETLKISANVGLTSLKHSTQAQRDKSTVIGDGRC